MTNFTALPSLQHSKTDWYSPLLGPVLALVFPAWVPSEEYPATACAHEWSAMLRSNWLMGESVTEPRVLITFCAC